MGQTTSWTRGNQIAAYFSVGMGKDRWVKSYVRLYPPDQTD
ncbi:MAG: hypothetical protein AB3N23_02080 [Paracoccaceae bacterium]